MALEDLSAQMMLMVTTSWLDPLGERPLLESLPLVSGLLGKLEEVHQELIRCQRAQTHASNELVSLRKAQIAADMEHDRKARGIFTVLTGLAQLADDSTCSQRYLRLRDALFPAGLHAAARASTEEARQQASADVQLGDDTLEQLSSIPTPDGSLRDAYEAWTEAGEALSRCEAQRQRLEQQRTDGSRAGQDPALALARQRWAKTVRAFISTLELEGIEEHARLRLLERLREAEARVQASAGEETPAAPTSTGVQAAFE